MVGIDLTKYSLIQPTHPPGYENVTPAPTNSLKNNNLLDIQSPTYEFKSAEKNLEVNTMFYNGHLTSLTLYSQTNYIYSGSPPTDIQNQATNILKKYESFLKQSVQVDSSFLLPMENLLKSNNNLTPGNKTINNITFEVTSTGSKTRLQWIYTEEGLTIDRKRIDIAFQNNELVSFTDRWSLYKISGPSVISSDDATNIALQTAQNVELQITSADGTNKTVNVPDLSNAPYQIYFSYIPYEGDDPEFPSHISRDPLTLYPLWQFQFFFNESIANDQGVQVGIWGDTKDVFYASGFGYLGSTGVQSISGAQEVTAKGQNQPGNSTIQFLAIGGIVLLIAIITSVIAIKRIQRKKIV